MDSVFLLRLAKLMAGHPSCPWNTISTIGHCAEGDGGLFRRFEQGKDCTTQRAKRIGQWFSDNWPEDLEWPRDIPRPRPQARVAA